MTTDQRTPSEERHVDDVVSLLERDLWAGGTILRGQIPRVPVVSALPTASADFAGCLARLPGDGSTTPDVVYCCLRNSSGVWGWRTVATG